jgi:hypothetical protein
VRRTILILPLTLLGCDVPEPDLAERMAWEKAQVSGNARLAAPPCTPVRLDGQQAGERPCRQKAADR